MALDLGTLVAHLDVDEAKFTGKLAKADSTFSKFTKGLGTAAVAGLAGAAVGAGAATVALFNTGVQMDALGLKAGTVFGDQLGAVQTWASESAGAMGLTQSQATGLAAGFADLLIPMGFTREQAAGMSTDVIGLSGALSEWSGGQKSASEVAEILSAAMLGETDSLKSLGIAISAADIEARLAAQGQTELTGAAREQAEALAIQALILAKSTDAQAAFASGADEPIRKTAELKARALELRDSLAGALAPAFGRVLDGALSMADTLPGAVAGAWAQVREAVTSLDIDIDWAALASSVTTGISTLAQPIIDGLREGVGTGDYSGLGTAIGEGLSGALNGVVDLSGDLFTTISTAIGGVDWGSLALQVGQQAPAVVLGFVGGLLTFDFGAIWDVIANNWSTLLIGALGLAFAPAKFIGPLAGLLGKIPFVGKFVEAAVKWVSELGTKITENFLKPVWDKFVDGFRAAAPGLGNGFKSLLDGLVTRASGFVDGVSTAVRALPGKIAEALGGLANAAGNRVGQMVVYVQALIREGMDTARALMAAAMVRVVGAILEKAIGAGQAAGKVVTAVRTVLSGMASSAAEWGRNVVQGLINGIGGMVAKAKAKAVEVAKGVADSIKKTLGIASPSKVMIEVGKWVGEGLVIGMTGTEEQVRREADQVASMLEKGFTERLANADLGYEASLAVLGRMGQLTDGLRGIAVQRDAVATQIADSTKALEQAVKLRDDFAASVASSAAAVGKLTSLKPLIEGGGVNTDDIRRGLSDGLDAIMQFSSDLDALRRAGISDGLYRQLVEAGVEAGGELAKALRAGGPQALEEINALSRQLDAQAKGLGLDTSSALFDAGVQSAEGLIRGLSSKEGDLLAKARSIAEAMAAEIRKALDIRSPSRVTAEIGRMVGAGLVVGLDGSSRGVAGAARALAAAAVPVPTIPGAAGFTRGDGSLADRVTASSVTAVLSEQDRALLREVAERPVQVDIDGVPVARSVNRVNRDLARQGLSPAGAR